MYLHSCPLFRLLPCLVCGHLSLDGCAAAEQNGARGSSKRRLEDGDCVRFESGSGWADIEGARQPAGLLQISLYSFFFSFFLSSFLRLVLLIFFSFVRSFFYLFEISFTFWRRRQYSACARPEYAVSGGIDEGKKFLE